MSGSYTRTVTEVAEWVWGLLQGGFNEQQTISQILVDAVIGMIPVVGDVTAVRDILAVVIRLADHPERRDEPMQWVELVIGLFALIPVAGGAIKGVGRLLMRVGSNVAEHPRILTEAITLLNRVGQGDAVRYLRGLDLNTHTATIRRKYGDLLGRLDGVLSQLVDTRLVRWTLPTSLMNRLRQLKVAFQQLAVLGDRMIPDAIRTLNERLQIIQRHMYQGEYHQIPSSLRSHTREAEAGLVRVPPLPSNRALRHPPANRANYTRMAGYPDLTRPPAFRNGKYEVIESFSGAIRARRLTSGKIYRVLDHRRPNGRAGAFWSLEKPASGRAWREDYAVLESWSENRIYIEYNVPPGGLWVWEGRVASQVERNAAKESSYGQVLDGGATQLYVDFNWPANAHARPAVELLPLRETHWNDHLGVNVPPAQTRAVLIGQAERASKAGEYTAVTRVSAATVRANRDEERGNQ